LNLLENQSNIVDLVFQVLWKKNVGLPGVAFWLVNKDYTKIEDLLLFLFVFPNTLILLESQSHIYAPGKQVEHV